MNKPDFTLETYEWDNVWWEHAADAALPRALIIGDSITCGYRGMVNPRLAGLAFVDGFGTSKAVDNPWFAESVLLFMRQMARCEAVIFNNGLHGFHLSAAEYEAGYRKVLGELMAQHPDKKWTLVLSTPVRNTADLTQFTEQNEQVLERNGVVRRIASELNLPVLDYYALLENRPELWSPDGVHLCAAGYELLADTCCAHLKTQLSL